MSETPSNWTAVMTGIFALVGHTFKYRENYDCLPNHHYMMSNFKISYEVADHVIKTAAIFSKENWNDIDFRN